MNAYWIHCDIDGSGVRWRLAVDRGGEVYFPAEDFGEEMYIEEYREEFPRNAMMPCRAPTTDPRVTERLPVEPPRNDGHMRMAASCSACCAEGLMTRAIGDCSDDAWTLLRGELRKMGWLVLQGDERPVVSRPRHAKSTRLFCPSCVEELRVALVCAGGTTP